MAHHVIYIPGLGDDRNFGQPIALQLWRLAGLKPHYVALGWANPEGFDVKLKRLLQQIDQLLAQGHDVSLVGVSAGASAVLNAYAQQPKLRTVICLCGKIQNPRTVSAARYSKNPDFKESLSKVANSLQQIEKRGATGNIMSIHPWRDPVVSIADTIIPGATERTCIGIGHVTGIMAGVLLGGPMIARFIRNAKTL